MGRDDSEFEKEPKGATLRMHRPREKRSREILFRLISGSDAGKEYILQPDANRLSFGSSPENDVVLTDPTVSRHHAEVIYFNQILLLRDLRSTNGTFVDGVRIQEAPLGANSWVRMGRSEFRVIDPSASEDGIFAPDELWGNSAAIKRVYELIEKTASTDLTVLISGETGTGKELVARALHQRSGRFPLVIVDCSTLPENLVESELFGHEKGAFTGASAQRKGAFEQAHQGTVLLDEIGEVHLSLQPKLLRVLENRQIRRIGNSNPFDVDVRVIASTNRDLKLEVREGRFREDLYYRLSVLEIVLPPLRERKEDIPLLVEYFLQSNPVFSSQKLFSEPSMNLLMEYDWPGNVRQLKNLVDRVQVLNDSEIVEADTLRPFLPPVSAQLNLTSSSLTEVEKVAIENALRESNGNKMAAARKLGIAYSTLYEKLKKYKI
jgi:transcriptional regulator with PAS, ATPase and Fis domain